VPIVLAVFHGSKQSKVSSDRRGDDIEEYTTSLGENFKIVLQRVMEG
jgi:hypothetical protein